MENQNNVQKNWRTQAEKRAIISKWQESGKSRREFCEENGINYNSLVSWSKQLRDKKPSPGFVEVKMESPSSLFAQIHLPSGMKIDLYQPITAELFRALVK